MDAKPHRPLRSMRTFNDENAPPESMSSRVIHHRNKSSPALSSAANAAGLKGVAKRTAFGDVSNTAAGVRTAKEDAHSKPAQVTAKLSHTIHERKSAAFLRPAQRPISVSNLKSLFTGSLSGNGPPVESQQKPSSSDVVPVQPSANIRKLLGKRNTTIFKDTPLDTVQEIDSSDPSKKLPPTAVHQQEENISSRIIDIQQDPQLHFPPPCAESAIDPVKDSQIPPIQPVSAASDHVHVNDVPPSNEVYYAVNQPLEVIVESSSKPSVTSAEELRALDIASSVETIAPTVIKTIEPQLPLPPLEQAIGPQAFAQLQHHTSNPTHAEPEEYWEEEDAYEEEGYVTARSFPSKGENTTGGATMVLVPRMNQRARREIEAATKLVEATRTIEEIEDESFDTSMVAEYGDEIFEYMRQLEVKMSPNPHYMDNQHEIQWSMRSVLMDWLVQVHHRFNLLPETLFLCVNYIDRFLSCKVVSLGKLQLVGATAIFIAAKYEEINCPSVQEIVYMVDGGYSIDEILKAERFMLTMLQFELGWPGPMSFLRRISKADDYDLETRTLAKYFLEVTLMDERFIGSPPSFTAAASHCLARLMLRKGLWSPHHVYYSGYTYTQLRPLVQLLLECCEDPLKHHRAVYDKYCDKRYKRASAFVQTEIQRGFHLPDPPTTKTFSQSPTYPYYANASYFGA